MKVKIMQRSVYHKYAEVEIEIDKEDYEDYISEFSDGLGGYLNYNEDLYIDKIDEAISETNIEYGSGVEEYRGMCELEADSEWRYECEQLKTGGHL